MLELQIAFGVNQWPKYEEKLATFLDVVLDHGRPFVRDTLLQAKPALTRMNYTGIGMS